MNQYNYLIPANTKKSQLILGFFTPTDLVIFGVGVFWTVAMLLIIKSLNIWIMIVVLLPLLICSFLVMPIPHYHNVKQLILNVFNFYTGRRKYYWKGWCIYEGSETTDK